MVNAAQVMQSPGFAVGEAEVLKMTHTGIGEADIAMTLTADVKNGIAEGIDSAPVGDNRHPFALMGLDKLVQECFDAAVIRIYLAVNAFL